MLNVGSPRRLWLLQVKNSRVTSNEGHNSERLIFSSGNLEGFLGGRYNAPNKGSRGEKKLCLADFYTLRGKSMYVEEVRSPVTGDVKTRSESEIHENLCQSKHSSPRRSGHKDWLDDDVKAHLELMVPLRRTIDRARREKSTTSTFMDH